MLAQRLYEAGYITYMRTDSTNLSQDALNMVRSYIEKHYGVPYLPTKPNFYSSKENAQEAHEAIRPSDIHVGLNDLVGMEKDAVRLYDLIWRQFVACQMPAAQYDSTTLTVTAGDYTLTAKGRILRFDGWTKVLPQSGKSAEDQALPDVAVNTTLNLLSVEPQQDFTKPPARFSEAALVKELEKRGIGRHRHNHLRTRRRKVLNGNQQRPHHIRDRMHPFRPGRKPIPVPVKIRRRLGQPGLVLRWIPERLRRHRRLNRIHHRRAGGKITLRHPQRKNISPITGPLHSVSGLQLIVRRKTHASMVVLMKVQPRRTKITTRYYA